MEASCGRAGRDATGARSGQATGRLRPGEEEKVAFFFSLESFKLHCHDCFYLKKKMKQNKKEKLL